MLFPISPEDAKEMENFEEEWIGTVTNNIKTTHISDNFSEIDCNESEYNIYNTPIGHFVGYTREIFNGRRNIVIYKPVSLRRLPEDISKDNILRKKLVPNKDSSKSSAKKLVMDNKPKPFSGMVSRYHKGF